jgi:hypothetical protein
MRWEEPQEVQPTEADSEAQCVSFVRGYITQGWWRQDDEPHLVPSTV